MTALFKRRSVGLAMAALWVPLMSAIGDRPSAIGQEEPRRPSLSTADSRQPTVRPAEAAQMLWAIAKGSNMAANEGWFKPSQSRYGWKWLFERFDADKNEKITKEELKSGDELFQRLDRNRDGGITQDDLDWSSNSTFARQSMPAMQWFRMYDQNSNGKLSKAEWEKLFDRAAKGKDFLTPDDLRELFPMTPPPRQAGAGGRPPEGGPSRKTLLMGLLSGEIGSFREGPAIGDEAPDFKLRTHDAKREIALAEFRGKKPVVLVFGSFT